VAFIPGKFHDLSLEGCCIETKLPVYGSARAEIVVRTKSNSFRAIGEVRTIRSDFVAGVEFVRLSAGGKGLLKGLMVDLAKVQAVIDKLKSDGNELGPELLLQELKYRKPASGNAAHAVSVLEQLQSQPTCGATADSVQRTTSRRRGTGDSDRFILDREFRSPLGLRRRQPATLQSIYGDPRARAEKTERRPRWPQRSAKPTRGRPD
jgi:hypothetical protein